MILKLSTYNSNNHHEVLRLQDGSPAQVHHFLTFLFDDNELIVNLSNSFTDNDLGVFNSLMLHHFIADILNASTTSWKPIHSPE